MAFSCILPAAWYAKTWEGLHACMLHPLNMIIYSQQANSAAGTTKPPELLSSFTEPNQNELVLSMIESHFDPTGPLPIQPYNALLDGLAQACKHLPDWLGLDSDVDILGWATGRADLSIADVVGLREAMGEYLQGCL